MRRPSAGSRDAGTEEAQAALRGRRASGARAPRCERRPRGARALARAGARRARRLRHRRRGGARPLERGARAAPVRATRSRRAAGLRPQERMAALLGGHARALACEELALRARQDLDAGQLREAALQLRAALAAALVELPADRDASADMPTRVTELQERAPAVATLAEAALTGPLPAGAAETLGAALQRLEAALRARIAAG